ncbi:phosphatases II [Boletus reticuloceps]|uniref:protein-tyrosine-phosphatase n=1 Tax=Boletus reticuloceps TaxID=495285 RepID=A0A8I2Z064_9AGAM|nr:phosphatases II [Boletus reticuloceps]
MKNLSINLPSPNPSSLSLLSPVEPPPSAIDPHPPLRPRRPSVLSLPNTSLSTAIHRQDEDGSPTIPMQDNARDWQSLRDHGISAILNVAKEVPSPFDSAIPQPHRPFASAPVPISHTKLSASASSYYPPHPPSGRPAMHYLKLTWSHGQRDLVTHGFPTAMAFVDAALQRNQGVLIHCQCGVSRSATLVIAIVMRAAATRSPNVPPDVWELRGMQAAYSFVKDKSRHVGPNMSPFKAVILLLLHRIMLHSASEEDKEWGRRRNAFAQEDVESIAAQQEARALDRAMEERLVARRPSASSLTSGMGMGSAWRCRYGRKRTGSIASIHTTGSVLSEDLVEADEESDLLGVGGPFDDVLEPRRSPSLSSESPGSPSESNAQTTHRHVARSYTLLSPPPSAPPTKLSFNVSRAPANLNPKIAPGKGRRRPLTLGTLPPVPPSPSTPVAVQENKPSPRRRRHLSSRKLPPPPPLKLQAGPSSIAFPTDSPPSKYSVSALPSQTLFVFPPSPTVTPKTATRTPATMTVTSNVDRNTYPFPSQTTPRVATSRSHGRTRSFIGLGTSVAPTTAYSRVDARGWVGLE